MVAHYLALADAVDGAASQLGTDPKVASLGLGVRPQLFAASVDALESFGLTAQTYTVIAPGAEYGPAKRWPEAHFAELIAKLDHPAVLLGSAKESALCEAIRDVALRASPAQMIHNLAGKTSLAEAIHIIASAQSMVSNDSGLMHVAAAFGLPQVAIFGSSDPRHTPPLNTSAKVLWLKEMQGLDCSPCFQRECPLEGAAKLRCLKDIEPTQVLGSLAEVTLR
jgi:heptosyltransferase-2